MFLGISRNDWKTEKIVFRHLKQFYFEIGPKMKTNILFVLIKNWKRQRFQTFFYCNLFNQDRSSLTKIDLTSMYSNPLKINLKFHFNSKPATRLTNLPLKIVFDQISKPFSLLYSLMMQYFCLYFIIIFVIKDLLFTNYSM